jgi:hypothetical protein
MASPSVDENILDTIRGSSGPAVTLNRACWLVWPGELRSGASAAMSSAQFVHFNAPVLAVQRNGRMEYFDAEGSLGWTSNLSWPRANLEMARLPGRLDFLAEDTYEEDPDEEDSTRA